MSHWSWIVNKTKKKNLSEPEDNPFVPDTKKIADPAQHEMVVDEDQEGDSNTNID